MSSPNKCLLCSLALWLCPFFILAQDSVFVYSTSIQAALTSPQVPLWIHVNQFGAVPNEGSYVSGQVSFYKKYHSKLASKVLDWQAGAQLVTYISLGTTPQAFFTDAFLAGRLGPLELSVGQKRKVAGLVDTTLTTGSIPWSGNARPMPEIRLSSLGFLKVPFLTHFLALNFSYSDALAGDAEIGFGNVNYVPTTYFHQKQLYIRVGNPSGKLKLYGGFNHQVLWGGESMILSGFPQKDAYRFIVLGKSWASSRVGNHFGTIDVGLDWKGKRASYFFYRQNIYEDGSLAQLKNISDGLNGLRISLLESSPSASLVINSFLIELLATKSQGGSVFDFANGIFGRDNYFNHYMYTRGWSYKGRGLGTPMIPSQGLTDEELPRNERNFTNNNRLLALHTGVIGHYKLIKFVAKSTISRNFGTYTQPFSLSQLSFLLHLEKPVSLLSGNYVNLSLAADIGQLYPSTTALVLGFRKEGIIPHKANP